MGRRFARAVLRITVPAAAVLLPACGGIDGSVQAGRELQAQAVERNTTTTAAPTPATATEQFAALGTRRETASLHVRFETVEMWSSGQDLRIDEGPDRRLFADAVDGLYATCSFRGYWKCEVPDTAASDDFIARYGAAVRVPDLAIAARRNRVDFLDRNILGHAAKCATLRARTMCFDTATGFLISDVATEDAVTALVPTSIDAAVTEANLTPPA